MKTSIGVHNFICLSSVIIIARAWLKFITSQNYSFQVLAHLRMLNYRPSCNGLAVIRLKLCYHPIRCVPRLPQVLRSGLLVYQNENQMQQDPSIVSRNQTNAQVVRFWKDCVKINASYHANYRLGNTLLRTWKKRRDMFSSVRCRLFLE